MTITVIIATCDRPDRLAKALQAVGNAIAATGQPHQLVVVDNGNKRSARQSTDPYAAGMPFSVRFIQSQPLNKAAALNAGIAAADSEWVAFTDDDCLPDPGWLAAGASYATTAGVNLFSGRLEPAPVDFRLPRWLRHRPHEIVEWSPAFVDFAPLPRSGILPPDGRVPFGANIFVRKSVFELYGGYDEALWARCGEAALGSEDAEFAMRVRTRGEQIGYCAEALVVHPVYPERTTLQYYLRHIYHAGLREPFFASPGASAPRAWLVKAMLAALLRAAGWGVRANSARAVKELMNATRDLGELKGWRRLAEMKSE